MAEDAEDTAPAGIDVNTPSTARVYDYLLGGKDNYAVDRKAGANILETYPDIGKTARANRGFLVRAVQRCAQAGITQYIDLGTGIPTSPNVHEVAREVQPEARVVYVDNDPVVNVHSKALRAHGHEGITAIEGDVRDPAAILANPELRALIDLSRPVAVLLLAVLHFVARENPERIVAAMRDNMAPGSYLVLSTATDQGLDDEQAEQLRAIYAGSSATGADYMSPERIRGLFDGFEIIDPGLMPAAEWCDDPGLEAYPIVLSGIGRR